MTSDLLKLNQKTKAEQSLKRYPIITRLMIRKIASMGSFRGNIGDILSNDGLKNLFFELFGNNYEVKRFEVRKTFRNYTFKI